MPIFKRLKGFFEEVKEQIAAVPEVIKLKIEEARKPEKAMEFRVGEGLTEPQKRKAEEGIQKVSKTVFPKAPGPPEELIRSTIEPIVGPIAQALGRKGTIQTPVGEVETPNLKRSEERR